MKIHTIHDGATGRVEVSNHNIDVWFGKVFSAKTQQDAINIATMIEKMLNNFNSLQNISQQGSQC